MKVYSIVTIMGEEWRELLRDEPHHRQCRMFTAAPTLAQALRNFEAAGAYGVTRAHFNYYGSETGNPIDCAIALRSPGEVWISTSASYETAFIRVYTPNQNGKGKK